MEIGTLAEIDEVGLRWAVGFLVHEKVVGTGLATVEHHVGDAEVDLLALAGAGFDELEVAAAVQRQFKMLVGPGGVDGGLKDEFVIGIDPDDIVVEHPVLREAAGGERYPVVLARQVEGGEGVDVVVEEGCAGGEDEAFPELLAAHGEGVVAAGTVEIGVAVARHAAHRVGRYVAAHGAHVGQLGDAVLRAVHIASGGHIGGAGGIGGDVHHAEGDGAQEVAVGILAVERQLVHPRHVEHHLLGHVGLLHLLLVDYLAVGLDDEPSAGARALVVARADDERQLLVAPLQPEVGPALVDPYQRLVEVELQAGGVFDAVEADALGPAGTHRHLAAGDDGGNLALAQVVGPEVLDEGELAGGILEGVGGCGGPLSGFPQACDADGQVGLASHHIEAQLLDAPHVELHFARRVVVPDYLVQQRFAVAADGDDDI